MANDSSKEELIKGGVELIKTGYDDAFQPVAKEVGKALGTIGKSVNVALSPLAGLVWSYDKIQDYLENKITEKLKETPVDEIITPKPSIAVPTIEALRYSGGKKSYLIFMLVCSLPL